MLLNTLVLFVTKISFSERVCAASSARGGYHCKVDLTGACMPVAVSEALRSSGNCPKQVRWRIRVPIPGRAANGRN